MKENRRYRKTSTEEIKHCIDCNDVLTVGGNWLPSSIKSHSYLCKKCTALRTRKWREANPEKWAATLVKYSQKQEAKMQVTQAQQTVQGIGGIGPASPQHLAEEKITHLQQALKESIDLAKNATAQAEHYKALYEACKDLLKKFL